jgi:hypothetical protein
VMQFGDQARHLRHEPLLLVPTRADPRWLLDMMRRSPSGELPTLRSRRDSQSLSSYVGHIGETAVYVAPLPSGESLLLHRQMLESLEIVGPADHPFVAADEPGVPADRCTLRLSWRQRVRLGDQPIVLLVQSSGEQASPNQPGAT